eukprot:COSAG05_NODE_2_length_63105_cov_159.292956_33_plen_182_part_00
MPTSLCISLSLSLSLFHERMGRNNCPPELWGWSSRTLCRFCPGRGGWRSFDPRCPTFVISKLLSLSLSVCVCVCVCRCECLCVFLLCSFLVACLHKPMPEYGLLGVNAYISLVLSSPFHARAQECSTALLQRRDQMHACLPRLRCTRGLCLASGDAMPCPSGPSTLRHQSLRNPRSPFPVF